MGVDKRLLQGTRGRQVDFLYGGCNYCGVLYVGVYRAFVLDLFPFLSFSSVSFFAFFLCYVLSLCMLRCGLYGYVRY